MTERSKQQEEIKRLVKNVLMQVKCVTKCYTH